MATQQPDYALYPRTPGQPNRRLHQVDPTTGQPIGTPSPTGAPVDYGGGTGGRTRVPSPATGPVGLTYTTPNGGAPSFTNLPTTGGTTPIGPGSVQTTNPDGTPITPSQFINHASGTPGGVKPTTVKDSTNWAGEDFSQPGRIRAFFTAKGLTGAVLDRVTQTWENYRAQPWAADTEYFYRRMAAEEELVGGGGGGGGYAQAPTSPFTDEIRKILLDRIAKNTAPFDAETDPSVAPAMYGANVTAQRNEEAERHALSEQLFAGGSLNNGMKDQQVQQSHERMGASLSTLKGNLVMKELDARRTDLTNLLQMALASGDADLARQTQIALQNLQAMIDREHQGITLLQIENQQNALPVTTTAG